MIPLGVMYRCEGCGFEAVMVGDRAPSTITAMVDGKPVCPNHKAEDDKPSDFVMAKIGPADPPAAEKAAHARATLEILQQRMVDKRNLVKQIEKEVENKKASLKVSVDDLAGANRAFGVLFDKFAQVLAGVPVQMDELPFEKDDDAADETPATATRIAAEELRQSLASFCLVVTLEDIQAWTDEAYAVVTEWLSVNQVARNTGSTVVSDPPEPLVGKEAPEHLQGLHTALTEHQLEITLAEVCALTPEQQTAARDWLAGGCAELSRPLFLPKPGAEAARQQTVSHQDKRRAPRRMNRRGAAAPAGEPSPTDVPTESEE